MASFNASELNRRLREAQRRAEQQIRQRVDQINRANQRAVDDYNRKAEAHNRRVIEAANAQMREQNRRIEAHNRQVVSNFNRQLQARDQKMIAELNRQLRSSASSVRYTEPELKLVDRVHEAAAAVDGDRPLRVRPHRKTFAQRRRERREGDPREGAEPRRGFPARFARASV